MFLSSKRYCADATENVLKGELLRSIILKVVSDGNINYVILYETEGIGVQRC